jgi:enoyl-CoA hydratase
MAAFETLIYEVSPAGIATIALDQPETRNALSWQVLGELVAALEQARDDEAVHVVVLASTHATVFSSGGNLAAFRRHRSISTLRTSCF